MEILEPEFRTESSSYPTFMFTSYARKKQIEQQNFALLVKSKTKQKEQHTNE